MDSAPSRSKVLGDRCGATAGTDPVSGAQLEEVVGVMYLRLEDLQVSFPFDLFRETTTTTTTIAIAVVSRKVPAVFHAPQKRFSGSKISRLDRPGPGKKASENFPVDGFHHQERAGTGANLLQKGNRGRPVPDQRILEPKGLFPFGFGQEGLENLHLDRRQDVRVTIDVVVGGSQNGQVLAFAAVLVEFLVEPRIVVFFRLVASVLLVDFVEEIGFGHLEAAPSVNINRSLSESHSRSRIGCWWQWILL
mmetsp:Transcript_18651/g.40611  ORF Transcript_18651/g.40611 Transcript_18651/m.40611 type:complete len:249 (-) Transcript_18651:1042-1788(-)